ncbi:unnamed protein product [Acanthosepion pharaonis]|uniref:Uncharacterized protein n=1 Tax=Acanthosepion pharaonis TaxID=158019 RepID=A0A812CED7_ACAPH|nr:unnamed protein product [Sepia pharaonis]
MLFISTFTSLLPPTGLPPVSFLLFLTLTSSPPSKVFLNSSPFLTQCPLHPASVTTHMSFFGAQIYFPTKIYFCLFANDITIAFSLSTFISLWKYFLFSVFFRYSSSSCLSYLLSSDIFLLFFFSLFLYFYRFPFFLSILFLSLVLHFFLSIFFLYVFVIELFLILHFTLVFIFLSSIYNRYLPLPLSRFSYLIFNIFVFLSSFHICYFLSQFSWFPLLHYFIIYFASSFGLVYLTTFFFPTRN